MKPDAIDWIVAAIEQRKRMLAMIGSCASEGCMCREDNNGMHHAHDCACHNRMHAMIELAKANSRFAREVEDAVKGCE